MSTETVASDQWHQPADVPKRAPEGTDEQAPPGDASPVTPEQSAQSSMNTTICLSRDPTGLPWVPGQHWEPLRGQSSEDYASVEANWCWPVAQVQSICCYGRLQQSHQSGCNVLQGGGPAIGGPTIPTKLSITLHTVYQRNKICKAHSTPCKGAGCCGSLLCV
ncbi:hypothetical protein GW7_15140 [Heterocephalus glaber]|uniref:Uncharacterized protein n=1 Tax=Heterocephalus glaber TaxID=10181 RepID=G5AMG2_HETGA|nr:hypothetical protein GW7_15140 [Heterocephalus glaber]